jgi:predicted DNA-binding protein (UPF0278 family)
MEMVIESTKNNLKFAMEDINNADVEDVITTLFGNYREVIHNINYGEEICKSIKISKN